MENNKLQKLKSLIELMQNDTVTPEVLRGFLQNVLNTIKENKEGFEAISNNTILEVKKALEYIESEHEGFMNNVKVETDAVNKTSKELQDKINKVTRLCNEIKECKPLDGEDGKDADEEYVIETVLSKIPKPKEVILDNADKIRDKLETLEGESRLDASAIKNLPEFIKDDKRIGFGSMLKDAPKDGTIYGRQDRQWVAVASGGGTVTSVSVVSANGFTGTVATATTTPAITIGTSITGLLYGNGTALNAVAVSNGLTYSAGTLKWGGTLTADTTISGAFNLNFSNLVATSFGTGEFTITGANDVMYANSNNKIFRAGDFNGSTAKLNISPGTGLFEIKANTTLQVKTPAVVAGTATIGQILQLTNATTGESEWATVSSGSGTVNSGTQYQMAFYAANGAAVSGNSGITTDALNMLSIAPTAGTGTLNPGLRLTSAAHTALTASTEYNTVLFNGAVTQQFATGALALQRYGLVNAPTYAGVGAMTITNAATWAVSGAPVKGTNVTLTNTHAILVSAGAVSTSTNSYGLTVNAQTGATNNYSAVFLGGKFGIGTTAPTELFQVDDVFNDSGTLYYDRLRFGTSVVGGLEFTTARLDQYGPRYNLQKARNSMSVPTIVQNNDELGEQNFFGYGGTAFRLAAKIRAEVDGTPGASDMPGRLTFWTTPDGTATPVERMRINNAGNVGIGTTNPTANLDIFATAGNNGTIRLQDADVTGVPLYAGFNPAMTANTIGLLSNNSGTLGGMQIIGTTSATGSAATTPIILRGIHGSTSPTVAAVNISGQKNNGSLGFAALSATEKVVEVLNNGTALVTVLGNANTGIGVTAPTAVLHLKAGTATASTAPLKFNSGTLNTTAEAGAVEFLTDKYYGTITTGAARKEITLNDTALTSGRVPFVTTNGRLTDDADMTFATDTLTVTNIIGSTSIKVGTVAGYISSDGSTGATGTFTTVDLKTVTVKDGIITSIV